MDEEISSVVQETTPVLLVEAADTEEMLGFPSHTPDKGVIVRVSALVPGSRTRVNVPELHVTVFVRVAVPPVSLRSREEDTSVMASPFASRLRTTVPVFTTIEPASEPLDIVMVMDGSESWMSVSASNDTA